MNLKLALRTLLKAPFVTAVAVGSLALGIGANAAIFSLFDQMLLRPLPVPRPEELVNLGAPGPKPGSQSCNNAGDCEEVFSYPMFRDLEREASVFQGLAAHRSFGVNLAFQGETESGEGMLVSGSYFPVLGLPPALGRLLGPEDDRTVGAHFVTVLGHGYWQSRFGGSPSVLGETLVVNGQSMTMVGVAPFGFEGTTLGSRPQVFVPITMQGLMNPGPDGFEDRRSYWAYLFARLRAGISIDEARQAINVPYRAIVNDVEAPLQEGMSDATLARFRSKEITVVPGARGQSSIHAEARLPLLLLLAVTGVVLLIACANIANLLLARGAGRVTEMAVRLSVGASRRHVVAQLLTESCLLGLLGGIAGAFTAGWTLQGIVSLLPADARRTLHGELDGRILLFTALLALGTGILFGLFPALYSTRPNLVTALRTQGAVGSGARGAGRVRTTLATAQIALSMALLVSAGLFMKSLVNVSRVDLGLSTESLVTFGLSPDLNGYTFVQARSLFERLEAELSGQAGVTGVTASTVPLLSGSNWGDSVEVEGFDAGPDTDTGSRFNIVGPGFFRTIGIPLISGREFTDADVQGRLKVAVVNEMFASKFGLGRDAVGKWMSNGGEGELDVQIVGLARDAKYSMVKDAIPPQFFLPYRQNVRTGSMNFYVRSKAAPEPVLAAIPQVVARLDPNLPVEGLKTMEQQVRENVFVDRILSILSSAFAVLATLLAALGLYGVLAYTLAQRTREIGLRMALGADGRRVRGMVLAQVGRMALAGGTVGLVAAVGLGRFAQSLLFEIEGYDPAVLVSASIVLFLVVAAAGLLPALRASRIDPMRALRYE